MATYSKLVLSGSTNGKAIMVHAAGTAGTTIHTAGAGTANADEIWLYAVNNGSTAKKITLEWGEATANFEITIAGESGLTLVVPGLILNNGLTVACYCETADVVYIHGYVNRITA